jgi:hypothetical protein
VVLFKNVQRGQVELRGLLRILLVCEGSRSREMADRGGNAMQKLVPLDLTISTYAVDRSARELVGTAKAEKAVSGFLQKLQKGVFKRYVLDENNEVDVLKADTWALIQRFMVNLKTTLPTSVTPCPSIHFCSILLHNVLSS